MSEGSMSPKRVHLDDDDLGSLSKAELIEKLKAQDIYIRRLESKRGRFERGDDDIDPGIEERLKQQQRDAQRRENTLVHRLTTKEQELQDYMNQIQEMKQAQTQGTAQLRSMLLEPAVNLVIQRMTKELEDTQEKLKQTQNELSAWKFTPDSQTGKRLMAKCRMLLQENEEFGKTIASGRIAKLEGEIALQKTLVQEMKNNQSELDEFLGDLEEDVEGMQTMIYVLQQQLRETKEQLAKVQAENTQLRASQASLSTIPSLKHSVENIVNQPQITSDQEIKLECRDIKKEIEEESVDSRYIGTDYAMKTPLSSDSDHEQMETDELKQEPDEITHNCSSSSSSTSQKESPLIKSDRFDIVYKRTDSPVNSRDRDYFQDQSSSGPPSPMGDSNGAYRISAKDSEENECSSKSNCSKNELDNKKSDLSPLRHEKDSFGEVLQNGVNRTPDVEEEAI
ncbi:hypothetical protein CHS0354_022925 [Potamilus streckersoni]|uniref:Pre-mRNA-splicing regulator WTAP n=1 Tax=Potamilus streckersoni TaxID=2493646 RepID=A0AAE0S532_9BIVA|nr:hypothetical protein CHS0354_022925 [Potamilus streckersoni]